MIPRSVFRDRRGQSLVLVAISLVALLGIAALAIDLAHVLQVRARLQGMADASALAAAQELPSDPNAKTVAQEYATQNDSTNGTIIAANDVVTGNWDGLGTFTPGGSPVNAVRVVALRTAQRNNPVGLFFARVFGYYAWNVGASAIATAGGGGAPSANRFILDEEILKDPAKKTLENLAATMGESFDWITRDNDGDWFIDIPPGTILKIPTGQKDDGGLFDIRNPAFPFGDGTNGYPTFEDFLNYNEDANSWRYKLIPKSMLDPLLGVSMVSHHHLYLPFINPGKCQVSPVYKSDVSKLNPVKGVPAVNALGWRNGLLAFSLDSLAEDPDGDIDKGGGSVLPYVWITVCDPTPYTGSGSGGVVTLPQTGELQIRLVR